MSPPSPLARAPWIETALAASTALFVVSFALPAYGSSDDPLRGWQCALLVIGEICAVSQGRWEELYMVGFALANFLFPTALFLSWKNTNLSRWTPWISALASVQVLSWGFLEGFQGLHEGPMKLRIGYFVWALAYLVGTAAVWTNRPRADIPGNPPASTNPPNDASLVGGMIDAMVQTKWMVSAPLFDGLGAPCYCDVLVRVSGSLWVFQSDGLARWTGSKDLLPIDPKEHDLDPLQLAQVAGQTIRSVIRNTDGDFDVELESGLRLRVETDHGTRLRILAPT